MHAGKKEVGKCVYGVGTRPCGWNSEKEETSFWEGGELSRGAAARQP